MKILLVEPAYKNKYPPLGLMKIAAFHKQRGDEVTFVKGFYSEIREQKWDRIYIATLFTFYWNQTIKTIKYYLNSTEDKNQIKVGGVMATLLKDEIEKETGVKPIVGLLNEKGKLGYEDDWKIDGLTPDYSILDEIEYKYPANDAYIGYMTRGCVRKCNFCAVKTIEPVFVNYIPMKKQIEIIKKKYGEKKDLLLLDNNVLASPAFDRIIDEIKDLGFIRDAKLNRKLRHVDFNQGIDARLIDEAKMKRLAEIPIKPLRIAFDKYSLRDQYAKAVRLAAQHGIKNLSNYILFNYIDDTPEEFYKRLEINIELNEEFERKGYESRIWSFPMKYVPVSGEHSKDRKFVGKHWKKRYLRGIQCILNATHGVVGPKRKFFETAFGKNVGELKKLLLMPDDYIIYREEHRFNGAGEWEGIYSSLNPNQKKKFHNIVFENNFKNLQIPDDPKIAELLQHYNV